MDTMLRAKLRRNEKKKVFKCTHDIHVHSPHYINVRKHRYGATKRRDFDGHARDEKSVGGSREKGSTMPERRFVAASRDFIIGILYYVCRYMYVYR